MSPEETVHLSAQVRRAVDDVRRQRGLLLDTWAGVEAKDHFLGDIEEHHSEGMRHGQPIAVGPYAFFLVSWLFQGKQGPVRAYIPCRVGPQGGVLTHPFGRTDRDEGFTDQNKAMATLLDQAALAAEELVSPDMEVLTFAVED